MKICINMPTRRHENWPRLIANYTAALHPGVYLLWQPVLYRDEWESFPKEALALIYPDPHVAPGLEIRLTVVERAAGTEPGKIDVGLCAPHKQNEGLAALERAGFSGWIGHYSDDNLIPRCFCRRWSQGILSWMAKIQSPDPRAFAAVLVASHKRGQATGRTGHHTSDLIAAPENMRVGSVSGEQYLVNSEVMRGRRFVMGGCCDGVLIEQLHKEMPELFCYLPDFFIPFNALETDRWTDAAALNACLEVA